MSALYHHGPAPGELGFDIAYPERLSRGLIFVKWLLVIPHLVVLYLLAAAAGVVLIVSWFAILILGRHPRGLWEFLLMVQCWNANVSAYILLQRDEYPPFGSGNYPVRFEIEYPEEQSRLLIFVRWLLVIPHVVCLWILGFIGFFVLIAAWFAILFTGRFPRGMFDFITGLSRWSFRVNVYSQMLTDTYPPFSLD